MWSEMREGWVNADASCPCSILRQEAHGDVFAIHPWEPDIDDEDAMRRVCLRAWISAVFVLLYFG